MEQYVSERSLLAEFAKKKGLEEVSFEDYSLAYQANDTAAIQIMEDFVKYMSVGVNNILNAYNPDIVIINSSFTIFFPQITKRIEQALSSKMNSYIQIVPSVLQDTSILLGGICVAIKNFLGVDILKLQPINIRN